MSPKEQEAKIVALEQENQALREKIAELERRLAIDSKNSSKPPSSDGLKKKNTHRTQSLRVKTQRATGGQKGHRGRTLEQVSEPDRLVQHLAPDSCWGCGYDVSKEQVVSIKAAPVKHLDETGFRISGQTQWLHVVSTEKATWYRPCQQPKDLEPLEGMRGRVIHAHWKSYFQLEGVSHGLCNAHHLRELKALEEIEQESWAFSMRKLLTLANKDRHRYPETIPKPILIRLTQLDRSILRRGLDFHESQSPLTRKSNRGRLRRRVGHNLLLRLSNYASDVLRFLFEPDVPFTNNQAERDLRMMKCKQKVSGCGSRF